MKYFVALGILAIAGLVWAWIIGIAEMNDIHPEYKGEDFLDWDDNKNHTEGEI
jgi:hypothetical protein